MKILPKEILLFCQVFGGFPFKYKTTPTGEIALEFSPTIFVYGITSVIIQTILCLNALYLDYTAKETGTSVRMTSNASVFAVILDIGTLNFLAIVIVLSSYMKPNRFIEICGIISRVNKMMKIVNDNRKSKIEAGIVVILLMSFWIVSAEVDTSHYARLQRSRPSIYVPAYFSYVIHLTLFVHFIFVTKNISLRFRKLNERLRQEMIEATRGGCELSSYRIQDSLANIKALMDVYWLLCGAVRQANKFYSSQLLVAIFTSFVHLTITLYYLFVNMWPKVEPEYLPFLVTLACWVVFHTLQLVALVWPSTEVTEAAEETGHVICSYINKSINTDVENLLEMFLLQIRHHGARFTALGLFDIHRHILTTIAASVTTYLVILIQFHIYQYRENV